MDGTDGDQKTVLVVEHDLWNRREVMDLLSEQGYTAVEASNGYTGLRFATLHGCDLILLALGLPELSGLETLRELKRRRHTRDIPVILIQPRAETIPEDALQLAEGIAPLPLASAELIGQIEQLVRNQPTAELAGSR